MTQRGRGRAQIQRVQRLCRYGAKCAQMSPQRVHEARDEFATSDDGKRAAVARVRSCGVHAMFAKRSNGMANDAVEAKRRARAFKPPRARRRCYNVLRCRNARCSSIARMRGARVVPRAYDGRRTIGSLRVRRRGVHKRRANVEAKRTYDAPVRCRCAMRTTFAMSRCRRKRCACIRTRANAAVVAQNDVASPDVVAMSTIAEAPQPRRTRGARRVVAPLIRKRAHARDNDTRRVDAAARAARRQQESRDNASVQTMPAR